MVKIVSTSAYGNNDRYIIGAKRQYELSKEFYPNWEFRLYTDDASKFKELTDANIIEVTDNSHGVFWRFLPLFENDSNIVIVRDSDGRITIREQKAVQEWLDSNKQFHIFRDHEAHYEFPIIACAFGNKGKLSEDILHIMKAYMYKTNFYTNDQIFLREYVFPTIKNNLMLHSMEHGWFGKTRKKLKNPYDFCGNGYDEFDRPLYPSTMQEMKSFDINKITNEQKYGKGIYL